MSKDLNYILRVLCCVDPMECDDILWVADERGVQFRVNANDLFAWASADSVDVTPENVGELERAYADVRTALGTDNFGDAQSLFACRVSKLRPQGCAYPKDRRLWPLFDAAGPERTDADGRSARPEEGAV